MKWNVAYDGHGIVSVHEPVELDVFGTLLRIVCVPQGVADNHVTGCSVIT